jgi:NAD(P)-dependent dehydrogenase (short-subunit alcohol dehydrogenase family)
MNLQDKVAVVTGGASGLGLATVEALHHGGAKVLILDLNEDKGRAVAQRLGDDAIFAAVNVSDEESVQGAIDEAVARFGGIHICVNCAGIGNAIKTVGKRGPFSLDQFRKVLDVNLVGTFNVLRLAAEKMSQGEPVNEDGERGVIINTASVAAFEGQIGQAAYSASKAGVAGMTLPIARDLSQFGIRVNSIAPGIFDTPLVAQASAEFRTGLVASVVFPKKLGLPEEYASLVCSIVENGYLNGEVIRLDGGIRMQPR